MSKWEKYIFLNEYEAISGILLHVYYTYDFYIVYAILFFPFYFYNFVSLTHT